MHPLQGDCDPNEPKQFAAWAFAAGIPDPSPVRPMPIPLISPQLTPGLSEMLWELGFRHHAELQTKWIVGGAGMGMIADMSDQKPEVDPLVEAAEEFLAEENPALLEAIKKAPAEQRQKLIEDLEKNFEVVKQLLERIKGQ